MEILPREIMSKITAEPRMTPTLEGSLTCVEENFMCIVRFNIVELVNILVPIF